MTELADAYRRLRTAVVAMEAPRDFVSVTGADAESYLQGQLSQDVAAIAVGAAAWSLVLQPQGKVDALIRVSRPLAHEGFVLDIDGGWLAPLIERLNRFKLRVDVRIEPLAWRCVALRGPQAHALAAATLSSAAARPTPGTLAAPPPDALAAPPPGGRAAAALDADWPGLAGVDLVGADVVAPLPASPLELWDIARIEAGVPAMGLELTPRTIPAEAGIVDRAVSFTKGCFTGQELVARIDSRGSQVPRRLVGVIWTGPGPLPIRDTPLTVGGRDVGRITSAATHPEGHRIGLAYAHRDVVAPAEAEAAGEMLQIAALPLVS